MGAGQAGADFLLIVNPASQNGRTGRRWREVEGVLTAAGLKFETAMTSRPLEATEIARREVKAGRPAVVAVGGDGTLNEVVNGFFEGGEPIPGQTRLGLLPIGTGADTRKTLGIPVDLEAAARVLIQARTRRLDAGRCRCAAPGGGQVVRHFINIADAGFGGDVVDRSNRGSKALGGGVTYMLASLVTLARWKNKPMTIQVDGKRHQLVALMVAVANCQYFGGGMWVAPGAKPDDGLFDVILVGDLGPVETLRGLTQIRAGTHLQGNPKIQLLHGKHVVVESPQPVRVETDGELPGILPATFEIQPGAVEVLTP